MENLSGFLLLLLHKWDQYPIQFRLPTVSVEDMLINSYRLDQCHLNCSLKIFLDTLKNTGSHVDPSAAPNYIFTKFDKCSHLWTCYHQCTIKLMFPQVVDIRPQSATHLNASFYRLDKRLTQTNRGIIIPLGSVRAKRQSTSSPSQC